MKKRLLFLTLAVALLVSLLALSALAADEKTGYCQACKKDVTWTPFVAGTFEAGTDHHYYLTKDNPYGSRSTVSASAKVCLDLNGKSWTTTNGRLFSTVASTAAAPSYLNIQDSVGGATVTSKAGSTNPTGGVFSIDKYCTLSIYGGDYYLDTTSTTPGIGGIAHINTDSTLKLYGGTLHGTTATTRGGAVNLQMRAHLYAYGGAITAGTSPQGSCVNAQDVNNVLLLSGNAQIDEIYCLKNAKITIDGPFTGKVNIAYNETNVTDLGANKVIGTLQNGGSIANADIYCVNGYSVAVDGTNLKLVDPASEMRYECPHCKQVVKWEPFSTTSPSAAGKYHFYMEKDFPLGVATQVSVNAGVQFCLDLQGHTYYSGGRSLAVNNGATLSIFDSVGGGVIKGRSSSNNPGGGTVSIGSTGVVNLYSGTLDYVHYAPATWGGCGRGGVITNAGTFNMYGGKVIGGEVVDSSYEFGAIEEFGIEEGLGGAIYNTGTLNLQGGEITMGICPESGAGPCIYMANSSGKVILGKDAIVADICHRNYQLSQLTVNDDFTGSANISYNPAIPLLQGTQIGMCDASAIDGTITCEGFTALPELGYLALSKFPAGTAAAVGGENFTTLAAAIEAAEDGAVVELAKSHTGDVTIDKTIILQMNRCSIDGTVTVTEGNTLYGMDIGSDDFTVADGKYGKITNVVGDVKTYVGANGNYILVTEDDGVSFHCVKLEIYALTLRVSADKNEPGIYYKSHFKADEKAAPVLESYGIALSLNGEPTAENMDTYGACSVFDNFEAGPAGNLGNASSTVLSGILKTRYTDNLNLKNLVRNIYGRPYAKTADGQVLFGKVVSYNLETVPKTIDENAATLSENQMQALTGLYGQFKNYLESLDLNNIAQALEKEEEGVLKVLVVGNSHGLDATNLLYEVFYNEAPQQKVVIGAVYYAGCLIRQHADFLTENQKVYTYHKNDGTGENRKWTVKDSTCLEALQDEQWDYIFMQQMNNYMALESHYDNDWKVVADYLLNNQDIAPKLGFHMVWANPDNYELFLNDDAPCAPTSNLSGWRSFHETHWKAADGKYDSMLQYHDIVDVVPRYLVNDTTLLGRPLDMVLPVGTAIQYAQEICGRPQNEIYRDYTHVNDYGRLIAAYTWYAELMGLEELTEVKIDEIPTSLKYRTSNFPTATDGKYLVTDDMKADLIESVNWAIKNPFSLPTE